MLYRRAVQISRETEVCVHVKLDTLCNIICLFQVRLYGYWVVRYYLSLGFCCSRRFSICDHGVPSSTFGKLCSVSAYIHYTNKAGRVFFPFFAIKIFFNDKDTIFHFTKNFDFKFWILKTSSNEGTRFF